VEVESTFGTVKQQEQEDETADHTAAAEPEVEAQDKVEKALPSGNGKEGGLPHIPPLCKLLANGM
jgi:hypothetical protein